MYDACVILIYYKSRYSYNVCKVMLTYEIKGTKNAEYPTKYTFMPLIGHLFVGTYMHIFLHRFCLTV